jgi:predicted transcriptional regulator
LYLQDKDENHYCWIQNLEKLFRSQITKHDKRIYLCKMCLSSFHSEEKLKDHKTYCGAHKPVRIEMPTTYDNIFQFKSSFRSIRRF